MKETPPRINKNSLRALHKMPRHGQQPMWKIVRAFCLTNPLETNPEDAKTRFSSDMAQCLWRQSVLQTLLVLQPLVVLLLILSKGSAKEENTPLGLPLKWDPLQLLDWLFQWGRCNFCFKCCFPFDNSQTADVPLTLPGAGGPRSAGKPRLYFSLCLASYCNRVTLTLPGLREISV